MRVFWVLSIHLYLIAIKHSWCSPLLRCYKKCHHFSLMRTEALLAQWSVSVTAVFKWLLGQTQLASKWSWADLRREKAARLGLHVEKVRVGDSAEGGGAGNNSSPTLIPFLHSLLGTCISRGQRCGQEVPRCCLVYLWSWIWKISDSVARC